MASPEARTYFWLWNTYHEFPLRPPATHLPILKWPHELQCPKNTTWSLRPAGTGKNQKMNRVPELPPTRNTYFQFPWARDKLLGVFEPLDMCVMYYSTYYSSIFVIAIYYKNSNDQNPNIAINSVHQTVLFNCIPRYYIRVKITYGLHSRKRFRTWYPRAWYCSL